jgi:hypothetical protein
VCGGLGFVGKTVCICFSVVSTSAKSLRIFPTSVSSRVILPLAAIMSDVCDVLEFVDFVDLTEFCSDINPANSSFSFFNCSMIEWCAFRSCRSKF